ncbi:MAG: hypothetical protein COA38_19335 [Fluviicola sp.]|nr:MAG: hypothetical protein COA38_19335 [Fluviicola sp.]
MVLLPVLVSAQDNHGYYGKKSFLDVTSSSYFPVLYRVDNEGWESVLTADGNALKSTKSTFKIGARVSVGRTIQSNIGVAVELGYDQFFLGSRVLTFPGYKSISKHERLRVNSFLILPKIEISGPNGLLPCGLVHQIGAGVSINKVAKKNYLIVYQDGSTSGGVNGDPNDATTLFENNNLNRSIKVIQLMYGLKMRTPVGRSMMINYGFRYTLDIGKITYFSSDDLARQVTRFLFRNLIAFDLGLTLPF